MTGTHLLGNNSNAPLLIRQIKLDKKSFNPTNKEEVTLSFYIDKKSQVSVMIYNFIGHLVRTYDIKIEKPGEYHVRWDGKRDDGQYAGGNVFLYTIEINNDGQQIIYNKAEETGGILKRIKNFDLNKSNGEIHYVLPQACMIRLRSGINDVMLVDTIYDWEPRVAGRHEFKWNGYDSKGLINMIEHPNLYLELTCYTLPHNTIITSGKKWPYIKTPGKKTESITESPWARNSSKYLHYRHHPEECHEPKFDITFPGHKVDELGRPVLSGLSKVRVEIDPDDLRFMMNDRYEIMLYVDSVFLFEMEDGTSPFTFNWNVDSYKKGPHVITVNVMSYADHIGSLSKQIMIGDNQDD